MAGMADVRRFKNGFRDASDGDYAAPSRKRSCEGDSCRNLVPARRAVRALVARMRRDDVPEEDAVLEPELCEHPVDDRRAGFGRAGAGQLALGRERNPGDAGASIPGGLSHQEERRVAAALEVGAEPLTAHARALAVTIEVEG